MHLLEKIVYQMTLLSCLAFAFVIQCLQESINIVSS